MLLSSTSLVSLNWNATINRDNHHQIEVSDANFWRTISRRLKLVSCRISWYVTVLKAAAYSFQINVPNSALLYRQIKQKFTFWHMITFYQLARECECDIFDKKFTTQARTSWFRNIFLTSDQKSWWSFVN